MRAIAGLVIAVAGAMAVFEITMSPSAEDRGRLLVLFVAVALLTALVGRLLSGLFDRLRSLKTAVLLTALAAVAAVGAATAVAARMMFLEPHDLQLLAVVLGFAVGAGALLAAMLASRLTRDLDRLGETARRIAGGDLSARSDVRRPDELGAAATALDDMASALEEAEGERNRERAARRHLLAAIGHDLRSPLAAIAAAVEALEDGLAADPDRYLKSMRADVDAMSHLVDDLLLLSTIEAGRLEIEAEPLDLAELADESIDALRPVAAASRVDLRLQAAGAVPAVGGAAELGRVIRNLLHNAIRFAPPGSDVVVAIGAGPVPSLEVRDEGPGFRHDELDRVFDEMYTGDPSRSRADGGTGLGLTIARGIIDAHGGEIRAHPGPGGRIGVALPAPPP